MKYYGKAENVAHSIIECFESGNIPEKLSQVFIHRQDNKPCNAWSFMNQLITVLSGTSDARGYNQWLIVGRQVSKGKKAFYILGPVLVNSKNDADLPAIESDKKDNKKLVGFHSIPVFRLEDTEIIDADKWAAAGQLEQKTIDFLNNLPLINVARAWGISVDCFNGKDSGCLGYYLSNNALGQAQNSIVLGVENLSTWTHELIHAADDKTGNLKHYRGQEKTNEIVAELGGAVLLKILGFTIEADLGGAWEYIQSYSASEKQQTIKICSDLINRTCTAVALVLDTAENLALNQNQSIAA